MILAAIRGPHGYELTCLPSLLYWARPTKRREAAALLQDCKLKMPTRLACLSHLASGLASRLVPKEKTDPNWMSSDLPEPRKSLYIMQGTSRTCLPKKLPARLPWSFQLSSPLAAWDSVTAWRWRAPCGIPSASQQCLLFILIPGSKVKLMVGERGHTF